MKKYNLINVFIILFILAIGFLGSFFMSKQQSKKSAQVGTPLFITITNSGSTNFAGYTIILNKDGSGTLHYEAGRNDENSNKTKTFPAHTFAVDQLTKSLSQIPDVSKIQVGHCMKSVSFGSITKITYNGKTSQDMSCIAEDAPGSEQDLHNEVVQIQQQALK